MTGQTYREIFAWLDAHQTCKRVLLAANSGLRIVGYVAYPALLIGIALMQPETLFGALVVPATGFVVVTLVRMVLDWPRPYEVHGFIPLVPKDTRGRSFPSRHVCSMVLIGGFWFRVCIPVGCVLLVLAAALAAIRVAVGVHFPRDVVAGYVFGLLWIAVGIWAL